MPLGWLGAFGANALSRRALGGWTERVVFSDPRDALPAPRSDYPTRGTELSAHNLACAVRASCTIPFALEAVQNVPGGPPGSDWDGGIVDYHLHLGYAAMNEGLVLDNLVLLAPHPDWVRSLPNGKLPDRSDFKAYLNDEAGRQRAWRRAMAESQRLADEFAQTVGTGQAAEALPLP